MNTHTNFKYRRRLVGTAAAVLLGMAGTGLAYGQSRIQWKESAVYAETGRIMDRALELNADILSPNAFSKAMRSIDKAESDYIEGKKLMEIRKQLGMAITEFRKAIDQAKTAQIVMAATIQARHDALKADAPNSAPDKWNQAESKLKWAAKNLEMGMKKEVGRTADEAARLYREAELQAIKENILAQVYSLLEDADRLKTKLYAPKTLQKAQDLVKISEKELSENREDTDKARDLARQARREARHAIYLGTTIQMIKEKTLTMEDVLVATEAPLKKVAKAMDVTLTFEEGFNKATEEIVKKVKSQQTENEKLRGSLFDSRQMANLLRARNEELVARLGGMEVAKSVLSQRLEAYERTRQKYQDVENMFTAEEALIFREGNDLRIRLTGLSFPVGDASIDPKYYPFLGKVIKAIKLFPNSTLTVEGHTDSYGSDETNYKLSMDRANVVMTYLTETMPIDMSMIDAIGYGETRPIASNETEEGRTKNRRIAVIIHPNLGEGW